MLWRTIILTTFILLIFFPTFAQEDSSLLKKDIESYTFEDFSKYKTSVTTKNEISLLEAPGSVTIYKQKDIQQLGYYTLRDLADITAGYSSFRGINEITFETRGQKADGFDNNKHLILIDGIPFSHTRANKANAEEDLPLIFAKRVEFLKGTGSALYGISAFSGVINIISKDLEKNGTSADVKLSGGNYDFKRRLMANIIHKDDDGLMRLTIAYFGKDATREFLGNGNTPNVNSLNYDNRNTLFANISYNLTSSLLKGTSIGFIYSRKTGGLGEFWMAQQSQNYAINELTWEQIVPYLKYERSFSEKFSLKSYLKTNISTEKGYVGGWQSTFSTGNAEILSVYNVRVIDYEASVEGNYKLAKDLNFILGTNLVSRQSTGNPETYSYIISTNPGNVFILDTSFYKKSSIYSTASLYSQLYYKIDFLYGTHITAGARLDAGTVKSPTNYEITNKYNNISPRIAVVQKISHNLSLKLLYGKALRAPLIKEVGLNEEAKQTAIRTGKPELINQIPNLSPETIQSFETSIFYGTTKLGGNITAFYNQTENVLGKKSVDGIVGNVQTNLIGNTKSQGIEIEGYYTIKQRIRLTGNYAYAHAVVNDTSDTYNVPTSKINGIMTYQHSLFSVSLIGKMITNYRTGGATVWGNYQNQLYGGQTLFDINIKGNLSKKIGLELQVLNLFNASYRTPAFYASGQLNVPGAKRSFLTTISVNF